MQIASSIAAFAAPSLPSASPEPRACFAHALPRDRAAALFAAAELILPALARGEAVDAGALRAAMEAAFGGSDADGLWAWKDAYEACEAAGVLFLRRFGLAMRTRSPATQLAILAKVAALLPSQTRRSEESQALQQFSTPIGLGSVAAVAAEIRSDDLVLEPSAGTGLLAIWAELAGAKLALNEVAATRAALLARLFPACAVTRHDAEAIRDRLDAAVRPSVVLMNPPFSARQHVGGRSAEVAIRHVGSALSRLAPGGRLVAITGATLSPDGPAWRDSFARLQERGRVLFSAEIAGSVFARHGTTVDTRLTVIDRVPAADPASFPPTTGRAEDLATLLDWVTRLVPPRSQVEVAPTLPGFGSRGIIKIAPARRAPQSRAMLAVAVEPHAEEIAYELVEAAPLDGGRLTEALYEPYTVQAIRVAGARSHPTPLVQSAAMASVAPPHPRYHPRLPERVVAEGLLSDAQLESVIYAGEAHGSHLSGHFTVDAMWDRLTAADPEAKAAVQFRRGWFLGDGTGAGKGRQVAGVILDNWHQGRRRALWLSKSDKLIEDARRDWTALGGERHQIVPLSAFGQGTPIRLDEGILFATYATLRSEERQEKASRVRQIVDWLGTDFDGVIAFDEAHAMANAGGGTGERGEVAPSLQGRAGLRLQHALPDARVLYVSATGATGVQNLAYAQRLGLWGTGDFPFPTRSDFVAAVEGGGVAAMEVLARDLKALGLYAARSLSYHGVEVELVEHALTPEQVAIYDSYAAAFQVIHQNLAKALEAANITGEGGRALNRHAKAAARSAFESNKQRFFGHLLTAMKVPTLIAAIERDLAAGHSPVIQLVSTGEALLERRLATIPAEDWTDVQVDVTPREYVLDYLLHSWPTQLHEIRSDPEGDLFSVPATDDQGRPVLSREAVECRDRMIERLASLSPVQGALDQIVQRFGTDRVAEVTGRTRRIVRTKGPDGETRLAVEARPASANLGEAQAFMDGAKPILVFSDAGGTGRSYHADLGCRNRSRRVHYLLEPGWRADAAIQGLGRTNRTNQAQPPLFRPVTTDVKGERRFISTIARRLDSLGAITRGQRQTGGQGLFRSQDNLESDHARAALQQFYRLLHAGQVEGCSLDRFEQATGLDLRHRDGSLREELPPISQFLNRCLALPIALQNELFARFEALLDARVEAMVAAGTFDTGVETLRAESLMIEERRILYTHPGTGAVTQVFRILRRDRNEPMPRSEALVLGRERGARLLVNTSSHRAAVAIPAPTFMRDDGGLDHRVRLLRPLGRESLDADALARSHWREADPGHFARAWDSEVEAAPAFRDSTFHVVTGLLLPIWDRLPDESPRVYRLQTDDGERVIGRLIAPDALATLCGRLGVGADAPSLTPDEAWAVLLDDGAVLHLAGDLQLRRSLVAGRHRLELVGVASASVDAFKALGLTTEIIAWTLRLFIPVTDAGPVILAAVLARHPVLRRVTKATPSSRRGQRGN